MGAGKMIEFDNHLQMLVKFVVNKKMDQIAFYYGVEIF